MLATVILMRSTSVGDYNVNRLMFNRHSEELPLIDPSVM
jgi:hypothetical protein